ncbi:MAG: hypothetical protein GY804_01070 [Alphaproteobacteria bacterium]|nr:hypothetical protein [Alphaproteobacteria bacterium]
MPKHYTGLSAGALTDINYGGSSTNDWRCSVCTVADIVLEELAEGVVPESAIGHVTLSGGQPGTFAAVTNALNPATGICLYFDANSSTLDLVAGDTIAIVGDETLTITLQSAIIVHATILFIDSNGHLYESMWEGSSAHLVGIAVERIALNEAFDIPISDVTEEKISIKETHDILPIPGETVEEINLLDTVESDENYDETIEAVTLTEDHFVERGITEETITVLEYNIFFADDIAGIGKYITDRFDMKINSLKTITFIKLKVRDTANLQVAIWYRYGASTAWAQTGYVNINKEGEAYLPVVGTEFRLEVYSADHSTIYLEGWKVGFLYTDNRSQRSQRA